MIVTICGSMRFYAEMLELAAEETTKLNIVIMPFSVVPPAEQDTSTLKSQLDELHLRKIDMADQVIFATNSDGYMGSSTHKELAYCIAHGKDIDVRVVTTNPVIAAGRQYIGFGHSIAV
jgi:hypothetical protein